MQSEHSLSSFVADIATLAYVEGSIDCTRSNAIALLMENDEFNFPLFTQSLTQAQQQQCSVYWLLNESKNQQLTLSLFTNNSFVMSAVLFPKTYL